MSESEITVKFTDLDLAPAVLKAVTEVGYETPSPIQAASIPTLLAGKDIIGQAQTGTGKTAAFALPLLTKLIEANVDPKTGVQLLILAPTRELAIQVAEACQTYAKHAKGFQVAPVYGGTSYETQIRQLRRGVNVVVGTPGRVMDHMRKGTLKLNNLQALVLDEADEMLRMGFIDDVEWILEQTPPTRQIALFSATMPKEIRKVAKAYLNDPEEIKVKAKTETSSNIRQRYWPISGMHKLEALTRLLEVEVMDAMIIFVRTKTATVELADKLSARGHAAAPINGDITQAVRERTIEKLKKGSLDILIATDVAARGIDVTRVSHVINYDIPYDTESYVHRIGRTGRAGRTGDAILFVAPRERRLLKAIERATKQPLEAMTMPSASDINVHRVQRFKDQINETLLNGNLDFYDELMAGFVEENEVDPMRVAAALAMLAQGEVPLVIDERFERPQEKGFSERPERERRERKPRNPDLKTDCYRIAVGYQAGVKPGNIVGAIANEAGIDSQFIGNIDIHDDFALVDLPENMPAETLKEMQEVRICGKKMGLRLWEGERPEKKRNPRGEGRGRGDGRGRGGDGRGRGGEGRGRGGEGRGKSSNSRGFEQRKRRSKPKDA